MSDKNELYEKVEELSKNVDTEEKDQDYDRIRKEIDDNILIRVMPQKKSMKPASSNSSNKMVGAIIVIVGILVMIAAVYIGYVYLINPQKTIVNTTGNIENSYTNNNSVTEEKNTNNINTESENQKVEEENNNASLENSNNEWVSSNSSSTVATSSLVIEVSTSTEEIIDQPISFKDSDNDGLSDAEEEILGSDSFKIDTDGDGYDDLSELLNLYNPAQEGKLSENLNFRYYNNIRFKYLALVPASWNIKDTGDGESTIFSAPDNSFFQIISEQNILNEDIVSWYNKQFSLEMALQESVILKDGWQGVYSQDKNIIYLTDNNRDYIYSISYVSSGQEVGVYKNIFQALINSFVVNN